MRPSARQVWCWVGLGIAGLAPTLAPALLPAWLALVGLTVSALAVDLWAARRAASPRLSRIVPPTLALAARSRVQLELEPGSVTRTLLVHDHHPPQLAASGLPIIVTARAGERLTLAYDVKATERGEACFGRIECGFASPLGLWWRRTWHGEPTRVRVYPAFRAVALFGLFAAENRVGRLGVRQRQRRGEGLEFHELREYRQGDMLKHVDWKATARRQKLITRAFRDEQDQQVVLVLDCGRRLRARDDTTSHFDHALNALLLLGHVALRQGDRVGLFTFGGASRWLAPDRGAGFFNALLNAVYDLDSTTEASDVAKALADCVARLRRRSLVVLISNFRDDVDEELISVMRHARARHLVLAASLRERALREATLGDAQQLDGALRVAGAHHYLAQREDSHRRLAAAGLATLDVEPQELPVALVNRYLDVKARGQL